MSAVTTNQINKREAVRLLGLDIGFRQAARQLGLNENTVLQWAKRYNWTGISHHKNSPENDVITVIKQPGQVVLDELAENERETRLSLSRYAKRAAKDSENATLREAKTVKAVAETAAITHGWRNRDEKDQAQVAVNIAILNA